MQARSHYKGITGHYKAIKSRYRVITESLRTVAQPLRVIRHFGAILLQRACAVQRHSLRSQPSSEGLAPWVVPSAPLPQGDSLWLAPSAHVCGRLREREAGRWPTSWGHYSTPVRILQWGGGGGLGLRRPPADGDGWFCLWLAPSPSISEGSGLACAVVPPAHPPTFLGTGGLPLYPRRGLCPLHPAWGGRFLTLEPGRAKHSPAPMRRFFHPQGGDSGSHLSMAS